MQEEEDRERLLTTPTSSVNKLFKRNDDPNKPRTVTQKRAKRQRRRRRKSKRRNEDEDEGLMFEMEDGKSLDDQDEDDISISSSEQFIAKPPKKWVREIRSRENGPWLILTVPPTKVAPLSTDTHCTSFSIWSFLIRSI